jgi:hypothetical protein
MKKFLKCTSLIMLYLLASCSKKEESVNCLAVYISPTLNFQVVDKTNNVDYFFSSSPVYAASDLKIYFKNATNKIDSISPPVRNNDTQKFFSFTAPTAKLKDTCVIKIKNLPADTLIFTVQNTRDDCPQPYINSVKINQNTVVSTTPRMVIHIKK